MQLEFKNPPEIPLRIGINAGDILLGPDGIYGDSVNIASRIERMSLPGSVLLSERELFLQSIFFRQVVIRDASLPLMRRLYRRMLKLHAELIAAKGTLRYVEVMGTLL